MKRSRHVLALAAAACAACRSGRDTVPIPPVEAAAAGAPAASPGERQRVGELDVEWFGLPEGFDSALTDPIEELLEKYERSPDVVAHLDDAAFELELALRKDGYPLAVVDFEALRDPAPGVRFLVEAGPRVEIGEIAVEGIEGTPFGADELRGYFGKPERGLVFTGPLLYDRDRVARVANAVERAFETEGYLDVAARVVEPDLAAARGPITLTLVVEPGARYTLSGIELDLRPPKEGELDPSVEAECRAIVEAMLGPADARPRPYLSRLAAELDGKIVERLRHVGFPDAEVQVDVEVDAGSHGVALRAEVAPGQLVRVDEIRLSGVSNTRQRYLESRVTLERGELFDGAAVRESVRRLYATGLFREVRPRLVDEKGARHLVFELVERPTREIWIEPGYGSYELLRLGVGMRERNFLGAALSLRSEAEIAIRARRLSATLTDPWLFRRELIGDLRLELDRREEPTFTRLQRGAGAFVTKEWTPRRATSFGYQFRRSEVSDVTVMESELLDDPDTIDLSTLRLTHRMDGRDNVFLPTTGGFAEGSIEYGSGEIGSELDFVRMTVNFAQYRSLDDAHVLAASLRSGYIAPFGGDDSIPLQERFFSGGENSVRSFKESALGPKDRAGEAIGGEAFVTLGVELRRSLRGNLQGALFVDAGNLVLDHADYFELEGFRTGIGVGLRYLLPVGPLRVDVAANPDPRNGESDWAAHFSVGMAF